MMRQDADLTLAKAAQIIDGEFAPNGRGAMRLPLSFVSDSREVVPGGAFIALHGARTNGHQYIDEAVSRGASMAIVEKKDLDERRDALSALDIAYLIAPEGKTSEDAAAALARYRMAAVAPKVVGVTGSMGKTTTKDILAAVLRDRCHVHASAKSHNTMIGCAMTLLSMPSETDVLILELGANRPGEIAELVAAYPVSIGVITEVAHVHIAGFGSINGVLDAKMELLTSPDISSVVYWADREILADAVEALPPKIKKISAGERSGAFRATDIRQSFEAGGPVLSFSIEETASGGRISCSAPIFGLHNARNAVLAYAAARELGTDAAHFARALKDVRLSGGRSGFKRYSDGTLLIDDTYNANLDSITSAIKGLRSLELTGGARRIAFIAGMRELGDESAESHAAAAERLHGLDEVHLIGAEWDAVAKMPDNVRRWQSTEELLEALDVGAVLGNAILVKGSRYYETERIVEALEAEAK